MSILLKIIYINDIVIPIFSFLSNILLLWLIKTVKTKNLNHINYSLIPNSILDIMVSILTFVVAPHGFHIEGNFYAVFGDLFAYFSHQTARHLSGAFGALLFTSMLSITVSFYVRYLVICKNRNPSIRTMILPYFTLLIILISYYILFLWFSSSSEDFETSILTELWKEEFDKPPLFIANKILSAPFLCIMALLIFLYTSAYILMFYYGKQISNKLKTCSKFNGTKLIHKQIQRTLFIQAIAPFLFGSLPTLLITFNSFLKLNNNYISLILSLFFPWNSLCHPIAAFIFIEPYRNRIKLVFKRFGKTSKIPSIS